jgi:8-oxo-dGTP pyrophosphatase MutT (NUDIX family)
MKGTTYLIVKGRQLGIWSFPKGHSRREEESLICAKREIEEETGICLEKDPLRRHRLRGTIYYVFDCNDLDTDLFHTKDTYEIEEVRWVTRGEMLTLKVNSGIKEFLQRKRI